MDFSFTEEQEMLRAQVRSFFEKEVPEQRVVAAADSDHRSLDDLAWHPLCELGVVGLSLPEDAGGAGMTLLEEAVVLEEAGRALYPGPYATTVLHCLPALEGDPELAERVVAGESVPAFAGDGQVVRAREEDGWRLDGVRNLVADADLAGLFVVVAEEERGPGLWAVDREAVEVETHSTMDPTRRLGTIRLSGAPATLLARGDDARALLERIRLRGLAGYALEAVGIAQHALDLSLQHAKERQQFGKPIGSYQAVSHQVADTYMGVELARSVSYWAAWSVATSDPQAPVAAASAKAYAAEAAVAACERAIQVHGGIGFTWEHVLHRYYKRAQWIEATGGTARRHRSAVAAHLLDA